jgi:hypothetical protein
MSCLLLFDGARCGTKLKLSSIDEGSYGSTNGLPLWQEWDFEA